MPINFDVHHRLGPRPSHRQDLQRGFMAEIGDPVWFLARQWQMGEHQGEDAASPVLARATYVRRPLQALADRPLLHPGHRPATPRPIAPAEAAIESEPGEWWTLGRRVRIGLQARSRRRCADVDAVSASEAALPPLPAPYDVFDAGYDGQKLHAALQAGTLPLDPALFAEVPSQAGGHHWRASALVYGDVAFPCDTGAPTGPPAVGARLIVSAHDGGEVDWWSADAGGDWSWPTPDAWTHADVVMPPSRLSYPGAPHPRWWQIEDARVDIGGFPPDRSHLASLLLLDLVLAHSDDWFTIAFGAQLGDVVTMRDLVVVDLFGEEYGWSAHERLRPPADWSLFKVHGLDGASLSIWPTAGVPLVGEALEEITLGVDEDANLMWAVEERAEGRPLAGLSVKPPKAPQIVANPAQGVAGQAYLYRPSTFVPHHWHPYVVQAVNDRRAFVQGRLMDYTTYDPERLGRLAPAPIAQLLQDPARSADSPAHHILPAAVPVSGLRLDRRYVLARSTDGNPVLWVQRRRLPLFSPPESGLRFDVAVPS